MHYTDIGICYNSLYGVLMMPAAIFIMAVVTDFIAVKYLKYLTSGLVKKTMILSIVLTVIGYIHIYVIIEKNISYLIADGVGANIGVYLGMKYNNG